jgi:hypothetical protein|tara:strand:+ start:388 stop:519 length:132 start_codon:yes stop_codon:yes gene_type:complete
MSTSALPLLLLRQNILAPKPDLPLAVQHKLAEIGGLVAATVLL